jgi:HD superfamily phosphohydrolase YqeK
VGSPLHPRVERAGAGVWPEWARVTDERHRHAESVAACLDTWARALGLGERERARWRAAGLLHDALRDAPPETFDPEAAPDWPAPLRHGPATALRLRREGVDDEELLAAIAYHTTGHPDFGLLGRFLYLADALEPGRPWRPAWRAALRARLPEDADAVLREVAAARIADAVRRGHPLRPETVGFWNALAAGRHDGGRRP